MNRKDRRRFSKVICLVLAVMLLVSALPMAGLTVSAASMKGAFFTSGNPPFAYVVTGLRAEDGDDTAKLYQNPNMQSYEGYNDSYIIPEQAYDSNDMRYYTVTEIGGAVGDGIPGALENVGLRGIVLPATVATIGERAFAGCTNLQEMTFPTTVNRLAVNAFTGVRLQRLTLDVSTAATLHSDSTYTPVNGSSMISLPHAITNLAVSAPLTVAGQVSVPGSVRVTNTGITLQSGASMTLGGNLSGSGVVEVRGGATLIMESAPMGYSGTIRLSGADATLINRSSASIPVINAVGWTVSVQPGETFLGSQNSSGSSEEPGPGGDEEPGTVIRPQIMVNYGGSVTVEAGGKVVVITPFAGYYVESVVINGLPMGSITRYEFEEASEDNLVEVTFALGDAPVGPQPPKPGADFAIFTDVPADAAYADAVVFLYNNDILQGINKTQFGPNLVTNRATFVYVMKRMETYNEDFRLEYKADEDEETVYPQDVSEDAWYAEAAAWAVGTGLLPQYLGGFWPTRNITREDAALCLYRLTHGRGYATLVNAGMYLRYSDSTLLSEESREAMVWAVSRGYLTVKNRALDPAGQVTRAEMAQMFARYLQLN